MANWHGLSRSNYFRVKDDDEFESWAETLPDVEVIRDEEGRFGLIGNDEGYWPSWRCEETEDGEIEHEIDIVGELAEHLPDGEVAVLVRGGHEKARYAAGYAVAFNNARETVEIDINDIYARAQERFGVRPTAAEY